VGWGNLVNGDFSVSMHRQGLTVFAVLNNAKFYYCWGTASSGIILFQQYVLKCFVIIVFKLCDLVRHNMTLLKFRYFFFNFPSTPPPL